MSPAFRSIFIIPATLASSPIPLGSMDFEGGLRLTLQASPQGKPPQTLLLDTGSSTLAFCDSSLSDSLQSLKTEYMSCNKYGSGNEGYWGFFYKGAIDVASGYVVDAGYFSIMQQEVEMTCGEGMQGIFGVAFRQLDDAVKQATALTWPNGGVGNCPYESGTTFVEPMMTYLKSSTRDGRFGIYWQGVVGSSVGELFVGSSAVANSHYTGGMVQTATLGEGGYYGVSIDHFSFGGKTVNVQCGQWDSYDPCLVDTGTPILMVPYEIYSALYQGQSGSLTIKLNGAQGSNGATLELDAQTLMNNGWVSPNYGGSMILGLPLWAFYYTVFDVDGATISFVKNNVNLGYLKNNPKSTYGDNPRKASSPAHSHVLDSKHHKPQKRPNIDDCEDAKDNAEQKIVRKHANFEVDAQGVARTVENDVWQGVSNEAKKVATTAENDAKQELQNEAKKVATTAENDAKKLWNDFW